MSEEPPKVDWVLGRKINRDKLTLSQAQKAHDRGFDISTSGDQPHQAILTKTVVKDMPGPRSWWQRLLENLGK